MELSIVKNEFINVLRTDNYSDSSIKHYQKKLDLFIEFLKKFFKVAHCEQLEKDHIKAYLDYAKRLKNKRTKEPLSYNSFYGIVCHARSFCSYLTANDYMEKDYAHVFFVKFKRVRLDKRILKESQMEQLFKHIEGRTPRSYRDRVIFELFYKTRESFFLTQNYELIFGLSFKMSRKVRGPLKSVLKSPKSIQNDSHWCKK